MKQFGFSISLNIIVDTVMQYITSDNSKYSPYVMHRVSKIKSNTAALSWRYIPGHLNLADDATRPVRGKYKKIFLGSTSPKKCNHGCDQALTKSSWGSV